MMRWKTAHDLAGPTTLMREYSQGYCGFAQVGPRTYHSPRVVIGRKHHYHSIHEACQFNPNIAALVEASGHGPEKVLRRALEVDPELIVKVDFHRLPPEEVKVEMPTRLKQESEAVARKKLRLPWAEQCCLVY